MALTAANIIADVRPLVADTDATDYRWEDATLLARLNAAVAETFARRPDSPTTATVTPPADMATTDATVLLRPVFRTALTYHVAWSLVSERSSDKSLRDQALVFRKLYEELVVRV